MPTLGDIKKGHKGHFFDRDTMRFFKSRAHSRTYEGPGGHYFVTSEQQPAWGAGHQRRRYKVRGYDAAADRIKSAGEFLGYKTSGKAHRAASKLALTPPKVKMTEAVEALMAGVHPRAAIDALIETSTGCQCENIKHDGACRGAQETTQHTSYGPFKVCNKCAAENCMPRHYAFADAFADQFPRIGNRQRVAPKK